MFTGIIIATGRVASITQTDGDLDLGIEAAALDLKRVAIGDSVSVSGRVPHGDADRAAAYFMPMCRAKRSPRPRSGPLRQGAV